MIYIWALKGKLSERERRKGLVRIQSSFPSDNASRRDISCGGGTGSARENDFDKSSDVVFFHVKAALTHFSRLVVEKKKKKEEEEASEN